MRLTLPRVLMGAAALAVVSTLLLTSGLVRSASSTQAAGDCTADPTIDSEEASFLQLINAYRAQNGLGPLALSYTLSKSAAWKSVDMAVNNYTAHDDLTRTWTDRIKDCGYTYNAWLGENIAVSGSTGQWAFDIWHGSAPHDANMLGGNYTAIGIGRYYDPASAWGWYWTIDLGSYNDGWPGTPPTPTSTAPAAPTSTPAPQPTSTPVPPSPTATPQPSDTVPPTVQLTNPNAGGVYSGKVNLAASASDNRGVARVEFYVDGKLFKGDTRAPYATSWNSKGTAKGTHTIMAKAIDTSGMTSSSSAVITTK